MKILEERKILARTIHRNIKKVVSIVPLFGTSFQILAQLVARVNNFIGQATGETEEE